MSSIKRFVADWTVNYVFFVPLVVLLNRGWNWPGDVLVSYLLTSILLAAIGGRGYSLFLKHVWYPLWKELF